MTCGTTGDGDGGGMVYDECVCFACFIVLCKSVTRVWWCGVVWCAVVCCSVV